MKTFATKIILWVAVSMLCLAQSSAFAAGSQHTAMMDASRHASGIIGVTVTTKAKGEPVQCFIDVETESGEYLTTVESSEDGLFALTLNAGTYVLSPYYVPSGNPRPNFVMYGPSVTVRVKDGRFTTVKLSLSLN